MKRQNAQRLLDVAPVVHNGWDGSTSLVRIDENCPNGHGPLTSKTATQGVLFRHGGYGAPVRTTWRICLICFWSVVAEIIETHPKAWA